MFTARVTESCSPVELPLGGLRLSQAASSVTDQLSVPVPEFHISSVWLAGFGPPSVALKPKLEGLKEMVQREGEDSHCVPPLQEVFEGVTVVAAGVAVVATPATAVSSPVILVLAMVASESIIRVHPGMLPVESSFNTQRSCSPAPKEYVPPATMYPPSELCWVDWAQSIPVPP